CAIRIIRTRVSYLTLESPDSARDTVDLDTDAAAATSLIVGRNGLPPYLNRQRWCTTLPLCGARAWPVCRCRAPVPLSARCRPPVRRRRGRPSQRSCRRTERPRRTSIIAAVPVRRLKRVHDGPMGHCNRLHLHSSPNFAPVLPENFPFLIFRRRQRTEFRGPARRATGHLSPSTRQTAARTRFR